MGVDRKVAQTHAEAMKEFVVRELVTNDQLDAKFAELRADLRGEVVALRGEMKSLEATLIRWMVGTVGVALGLALAFLRFLR